MALESNDIHEATARQGQQPASFELRPMTLHIGAEVEGIDLTHPLSAQQADDIKSALNQWKVLFFRNQNMDHDQQVAFAREIGDPTPGHVVYGAEKGHPEIYPVSKQRITDRFQGEPIYHPWNHWHTDLTPAVNPPYASILRAVIAPPVGGDTQWSNLCAAYDALSPKMQAFCDGLRAIHQRAPHAGSKAKELFMQKNGARPLIAEHPVVRVHPETGEKILFVSPAFLRSIVGMTPTENEAFCDLLKNHVVRPEFTVRFRWEPGDVAMWDNRSTCHRAPRDIYMPGFDHDRQFYRVTLNGPVPYGVDGRESSQLEGDMITPI
jgi:alpha-ketoglutarate-dependent taurine dioxygenase